MKKIRNSIMIFIAGVLLHSCSALDMSPEDYNGSGNFWTSEAQVSGFMIGLHSQLRGNAFKFYQLGELRGGVLREGSSTINTSLDYDEVKANRITAGTPGITNWNGLYSPIMQVNHFINEVTNNCAFLTETERNEYLGQAYGLRALYYFLLFKTYGGVPLVTTVELLNGQVSAEKFYIERSSAEETMTLIKEDIGKSESYFGSSTSLNRNMWNVYATLMLKADIYLWSAKVDLPDSNFKAKGSEDLNVAKVALQKVISATDKFDLLPEFDKVFNTKKNKEIIFSFHYDYNEATFGNASQFFPNYDLFVGSMYDRNGNAINTDVLDMRGSGGVFRYEYKESLWRSYDAEDSRRDHTFYDFYTKNGEMGCCMNQKTIGSISATNNRVFDSDYIIYRYADAILGMAECENGLGNSCASYINKIRQRAYGTNYNASIAYTDGSYAENELAILHERDKEFVFEGKRWFDVIRMRDANKKSLAFSSVGNYADAMGQAPAALIKPGFEYMLLWPIDVTVMNNNPLLKQTPGY